MMAEFSRSPITLFFVYSAFRICLFAYWSIFSNYINYLFIHRMWTLKSVAVLYNARLSRGFVCWYFIERNVNI